jgi:general secretion pathway protein A
MYAPYFGLQKEPFSIAPDPRFLFMSDMHREALAHLLYGLGTGVGGAGAGAGGGGGGGGFVLLTGEIGAGKTTVCRAFLEQVPAHCVVAYIFNPRLSAIELLQTVCEEFGVAVSPRTEGAAPTLKDHVDALNRFLLAAHAQGRQGVLIIDEAQSLDAEVLEQLRLLTNLETHERKLLQIVLIGQPELRSLLAQPRLEQLAQRVIARYHLPALGQAETAQYVRHRFSVAGPAARLPFDAAALARIHRLSGGVPRRINLLCDRALLGAYAHGQAQVGRAGVDRAAAEVFGGTAAKPAGVGLAGLAGRLPPAVRWTAAAATVAALALALTLALGWPWRGAAEAPDGALARTEAADAQTGAAAAPGAADPSASAAARAGDAARRTDPAGLLAAASASEDAAWAALGSAWGVRLPDADACAAAASTGLACYRSSGGLAVLRALDRPSLLRLRQADAARGWVRLVALSDNQATLQADGQTWQLSLPALATVWRGEFATLWRLPPGWNEGARPGAEAPVLAAWLQQQLTLAGVAGGAAAVSGDGVAAPAPLPAAAGSLRARVLAFQVATGLPPDGLAGPMTLMRLNRAAGVAEPRLSAR